MADYTTPASTCVRELAAPALRAVRDELRATTGYEIEVMESAEQVELIVTDREGDTFRYGLAGCADASADCAGLRVSGSDGERRLPCAQCSVASVRDDCLEVCRHWLLC